MNGFRGATMSEREATGLVETHGWIAIVAAADRMAKAARVRITRLERTSEAHLTLVVRGRLDAVRFAVDAGAEAARALDGLVAAHVIAHPDAGLEEDLIGARRLADETPLAMPFFASEP
jgi:microcompartment protein CcmL/EutN